MNYFELMLHDGCAAHDPWGIHNLDLLKTEEEAL